MRSIDHYSGIDEDDCLDSEGNVYPEHDFPEEGDCRRCGAEAEPAETEGAQIDAEEFSDSVRTKARRLVSEGRVRRDSEREGVWWVGSSTSDTKDEYRVELNPKQRFESCSCRFGLNQGGGRSRCSHVLAAALAANYSI